MKFHWACRCGDRWHGNVLARTVELLRKQWEIAHCLVDAEKRGHHECSPIQAARSRYRRRCDAMQTSGN
jgi:hypothetical protein